MATAYSEIAGWWKRQVPDEVYDSWAKQLTFQHFDAEKWLRMAKQGGMKYIVIITKHHDGFHMWDTEFSEYKITNTPFGRDYIKELVDACHKEEMKIELYYSQRDWEHPDYMPIDPEVAYSISDPPMFQIREGKTLRPGKNHHKYIEYMHHTVKELMTKYGKIDVLWWDACWFGGMFTANMWDADTLEREVRCLQPDILVNNRASLPGDFDTPEGHVGFFQNTLPWETCICLGKKWAWSEGEDIKSFRTILHEFLNCLCGDGNYLLSIGCMPNGEFDKPEQERIAQLGQWLKKYGESVYGTRGGPWLPDSWGGSVHKGNIIYLHIMDNDETEPLILGQFDNQVMEYCCLTGQ